MSDRGKLSAKDQLALNKEFMETGHKLPAMPENLMPSEIAEWERLEGQLIEARTGGVAEVEAMRRLVQMRVQYAQCQTRIQRDGMFDTDRHGVTKVAPWASMASRLHAAMLRLEREFGLTTASKGRVPRAPKQADSVSPFAKYRGQQ